MRLSEHIRQHALEAAGAVDAPEPRTAPVAIRVRNELWCSFVDAGWGIICRTPLKLYSELLFFSVHNSIGQRDTWATEDDAQFALWWLTKENKRYGFTFDIVPV